MRKTLALLAAAGMLALGTPAGARHVDEVTQGDFYHLEDAGGNLMGSAKLTRYDDDTTGLVVHVHGLEPGHAYSVHLHAGACPDHGPHYRHDPDGPEAPPNELWASSDPDDPTAGLIANDNGTASGTGTAPWRARPEARSVFIHSSAEGHPAIGCADLT